MIQNKSIIKEPLFTYGDREFYSYDQIIHFCLEIPEPAHQDLFVAAFAKSSPYALQNVGYYSGYYDEETATKIMEIFKTAHPIFGRRRVSTQEAFEMGKKLAAGWSGRDEYSKINNDDRT